MDRGSRYLVPRATSAHLTQADPAVMGSRTHYLSHTSGSTGKPKGVQHSSAGYLPHAAISHKYVFDYQDGDIYWCCGRGWISGHSGIVYGPLANGATTLMFEEFRLILRIERQVIDKHRSTFLHGPNSLKATMAQGDDYVSAVPEHHCTCPVASENP